MYWRVTPPLVEETTVLVERLEEVDVGFRPEPFQVTDFEVRPLWLLANFLQAEIRLTKWHLL